MNKSHWLRVTLLSLFVLTTVVSCGGGGGVDNCKDIAQIDPSDTSQVNLCDKDADKDGIEDVADNCPAVYNINQTDTDLDGLGDACDSDSDNDGFANTVDNCPNIANNDQANIDNDTLGDLCDLDNDNDGFDDSIDNCPSVANPDQADLDGDGSGDICDTDDDNDGVDDTIDNCPITSNTDQADIDGDGIGDACDPVSGTPPPAAVYCPDDTQVAKNEVPPTTNSSLGKVTGRQLVGRIMAGAALMIQNRELNDLVSDAFNAARQANNKTEYWNNCAMQASWVMTQPVITSNYSTTNNNLWKNAPAKVYQNDQRIIVAFQGTQSLEDVVTDIAVARKDHKGVNVHSGVANHYDKHKYNPVNGIAAVIAASNPNDSANPKALYFTGHSLGGSTANLALFDYVVRYRYLSKKYPQSYTFGANALADKGYYCVATGNWLPPYWSCTDNPLKFDLTTAYGYGRTTHVKNLINNFANVHAETLQNDPVPHLFRTYSHVGYHNMMGKSGDSLATPANGSVATTWRIRSNHAASPRFPVSVAVGLSAPIQWLSAPISDVPPHNLCFSARSLEYASDGTNFRWMDDDVTSAYYRPSAMGSSDGAGSQCVYN